MKEKKILKVTEAYRDWLAKMNLLSFDQLMSSEQGGVIEKSKKREIHRVEGHGTAAYLKRRLISPMGTSLEMYMQGQRAHTVPFNEYLHICALQQQQLPVMNVMAAGEQRRLGFPRCGFILVEEVKGVPLDRVLCQCEDPDKENELLQSYGQLMARLHQKGFYCPLRLQDIIVTDDPPSLVMIDRETRYPYAHVRSRYRARRSLRIAFRRTTRSCPSFAEAQRDRVMQSYHNGLRQN
jgi:hypothetical protein